MHWLPTRHRRRRSCGEVPPASLHTERHQLDRYVAEIQTEGDGAAKRIQGKKYPPGYIFSLNLRSHSLALLEVARPELKEKKKEHEISILKRLTPSDLRFGAPKGTKVLHVYDPAVIDYLQWFKWKAKGIYIITREKANSKAQVIGVKNVDYDDPRNTGIMADENVGVFAGVMARRVTYQNPETGEIFSFLTNQLSFPPGLIAFLYKLRWDLEKAFDEKKNKLQEKKAWATSNVPRSQQAHFVCMAHNLMLLLERHLEADENLRDEKNEAKRQKRAEELKRKILENGPKPNPLVMNCTRTTQRSLQFIRWLRDVLAFPTSWKAEITALRPLMLRYLQ